jgi:hypothetical protein
VVDHTSGLSTGATIGISVAAAVIVIVAIAVGVHYRKKK